MFHPEIVLIFLIFSIDSLVLTKESCPKDTFCFAGQQINITATCIDNKVISLKWNTTEDKSTVRIWNNGHLHNYVCSVNGTSPDPSYKKFIDYSKKLRNCEIQVTMAQMFMFQKDEISFLDYNKEKSPYFKFSEICKNSTSWEKFWKKLLVKVHAILMLIGWLFFIPSGFLFARFGKKSFENLKILNLPIWFQFHRTFTFLGVSCISISIFCIFFAKNFTWRGTGSDAWYWSQWHTDLGTISTILAVSQPLNSLLRCPPSNSSRQTFNWSHRIIGLLSYTFAVSAVYIAALKYRKTWSEPTLEVILASFPTFLGFSTWILFSVLESKGEYKAVEMTDLPPSSSSSNQSNSQNLYKTSWLFTCIGILLGAATSLSILVASKNND
ncbi:hypothetical protein B9Z55_004507 [Caenorhabditis nigoni]|uniref:ascorbate ferrireductase (transmembrane) n=1 Tax=Caenorhabditis nigoni TaxID=1611254 RepID=A0A2G5UWP8_9PELO|nr:hypothetical protein B9Z55_004507 [Caenorhabditis nigoni]